MSGSSYSGTCPKCGEEMDCSNDWKPYDCVCGQCLHCGFQYWTEEGQMSLEEVNDLREEMDMKPIKKLKKQEG